MKSVGIASIGALIVVMVGSCSPGPAGEGLSNSLTSTCASGWTVVPSPIVGSQDNGLSAVAGTSSSDVWAVGQLVPDSNPTITNTMIVHFNGGAWSAVGSPNSGTHANALLGVAAKSGKAWAVGYYLDDSFVSRSLIEAWNGSGWHIVSHPHPGSSDILFATSAVSPSDVWAVGTQRDADGNFHTLSQHFNGSAWSVVSTPDPGSSGNELHSVVALSSNDVWAVGQQVGPAGPDRALIEHWNGSGWSVVSSPADGGSSTLLMSVSALSNSDLLAVGDVQDNVTSPRTLAEIGRSGTWSLETSANVGTDNHLYGVAASSGVSWAVGQALDDASGALKTLIERRGSTGWTAVSSPSPSVGGDSGLGGVALVGTKDAWAVGAFDGPDVQQTLILHDCE